MDVSRPNYDIAQIALKRSKKSGDSKVILQLIANYCYTFGSAVSTISFHRETFLNNSDQDLRREIMIVAAVFQLVSVSNFHATRLRVPSAAADDVTSLVGHVVGVFSQHLGALSDAYDTYLAGIDDASDTVRQLMKSNETFAEYIQVFLYLYNSSDIQ